MICGQTTSLITQTIRRSQSLGRSHPPKNPDASCSRIMYLEATPNRNSLSDALAWSAPSPKAAGGWMM